jgi:hypothetical protein
MGRLEKCNPAVSGGSGSVVSRMKLVWSPSSSIERVPLVVIRSFLPFIITEDLFTARGARSPSAAFIRFREFSSTRADARPSMSRNLDASAAGMATASFWEWLCAWCCCRCCCSRVRSRADRARVRDERKGSEA